MYSFFAHYTDRFCGLPQHRILQLLKLHATHRHRAIWTASKARVIHHSGGDGGNCLDIDTTYATNNAHNTSIAGYVLLEFIRYVWYMCLVDRTTGALQCHEMS